MMQESYLGWGSIDGLYDVLVEGAAHRIFLVSGKESYAKTGAEEKLRALEKKYEVVRFFDFAANTKSDDVKHGCALFSHGQFDTIISVGGGSAIDMAKLIKASAYAGIDAVIDGRLDNIADGVLHIAIPTTAGTGSEATHFAVVYREKTKYSVAHPFLLPQVAIIDPQLTMSMSPHLTATTGLDALAQAIESYWSTQSTDESKEYAGHALEYIMRSLERVIHTPTRTLREDMAFGAHYAGKAINISKTTAPHALSYFFTSYFGIPHGHAVALTLGVFLEYNMAVSTLDVTDVRGDAYVRAAMGEVIGYMKCSTVDEAASVVRGILQKAGLATRLSDFGFREMDIDACVHSVNVERLNNNPRKITEEQLRTIVERLQ